MNYIVHYDIAALVIYIVTAVIFYFRKRIPCRRNKIFGLLLGTAAVSCFFDLLSVFTTVETVGAAQRSSVILLIILRII